MAEANVFTCILADDHEIIRDVTKEQLDLLPWLVVSGEAVDGQQALDLIVEHRPHMAVLDLRMPLLTGFQVATAVREAAIPTRIVVFSAFDNPDNSEIAARLGVPLVAKVAGMDSLVEALECIRDELNPAVE